MKIGIPRETRPGERRVAATPESVARLRQLGFEVLVQAGAGLAASFDDATYSSAGALIVEEARELWHAADIVLKVQPPAMEGATGVSEVDMLRPGMVLIGFVWPAQNEALLRRMGERHATVMAMDQIPRITRAQKYDALSSMANIAGYRAVIEAAACYGSFFTGQMTAAGKVPPAKVLVIGAGVAGLAAIGAARGLGAIVRAFDTRSEVREQVNSMGADFLDVAVEEEGAGAGGYARVMSKAFVEAEMALFLEQAKEVDIIITTALVPGHPAPKLITETMVKAMRPGSVIVDLAAETGGNCELTRPGEAVVEHGVTILGYVDLPSRLARTSSQLYSSNLVHLIKDMGGAQSWRVDTEDAVVRGALVLKDGELMWPPPKIADPSPAPRLSAGTQRVPSPLTPGADVARAAGKRRSLLRAGGTAVLIALLVLLGAVAPSEFLSHLTVFVLACFVGWQVVWNVTPALHTPLMSVTNAISGIIILGGMLQLTTDASAAVVMIGAAAVLLASINVVGGFVVTQRMLRMFRR